MANADLFLSIKVSFYSFQEQIYDQGSELLIKLQLLPVIENLTYIIARPN